jgi:hypothetical protein
VRLNIVMRVKHELKCLYSRRIAPAVDVGRNSMVIPLNHGGCYIQCNAVIMISVYTTRRL